MALVTRPIALFLLFFCANIQNLIFGGRAIFPFREYFLSPCDRPDERAATRVIKDNVAAIFVYDPYKRKTKRSTENGDSSSLPLFLFRTIRVRFLVHNLKSSNQNEKRLPSWEIRLLKEKRHDEPFISTCLTIYTLVSFPLNHDDPFFFSSSFNTVMQSQLTCYCARTDNCLRALAACYLHAEKMGATRTQGSATR